MIEKIRIPLFFILVSLIIASPFIFILFSIVDEYACKGERCDLQIAICLADTGNSTGSDLYMRFNTLHTGMPFHIKIKKGKTCTSGITIISPSPYEKNFFELRPSEGALLPDLIAIVRGADGEVIETFKLPAEIPVHIILIHGPESHHSHDLLM
ncbi:MAG: hypothetical protein R3B60_05030 [Candidatus Paceibacterota bacterium]